MVVVVTVDFTGFEISMSLPSKPRRSAEQAASVPLAAGRAASKNADEQESVGYLSRYVYRAFAKAIASELAPLGLVSGQWSVLRVLWREEGLSQVRLAECMRVEKASLTNTLESMTRKGLILREPNTKDRRKVNIFLTAKGRRLKDSLLPYADKINRRATKGMSADEVDHLKALLFKVIANLEK